MWSPVESLHWSCVASRPKSSVFFKIVYKIQRNFLVELADQKIKKLAIVNFIIYLLLVLGHSFSK